MVDNGGIAIKIDRLMLFNAMLAFIFELRYLSFPAQGLAVPGLSTNLTGLYMTRFFGSALTAIGCVCFSKGNGNPQRSKVSALPGIFSA